MIKSKRRALVTAAILLLVVTVAISTGLGVLQTVLTVLKPSFVDMQAKAVPVTVTSFKFLNLDPKTRTYSTAQLGLQNNDTANSYTVNVYVYLYDSSGTTIASGSYTGLSLSPGGICNSKRFADMGTGENSCRLRLRDYNHRACNVVKSSEGLNLNQKLFNSPLHLPLIPAYKPLFST